MNFENEFQESDIIFSLDYSWDQINGEGKEGNERHLSHYYGQRKSSMPPGSYKKEKGMSSPRSVPVSIPVGTGFCRYDTDVARPNPFDQSSDEDHDDDMTGRLPPHLIVERRVSGEIARSFSPLKGRNLCQVRNSVLRMTGFLER